MFKHSARSYGSLSFSMLAVMVGIVAGLGAVAFRSLIGFFHNLLFLGELSLSYDANFHTPASPWGPWVILVPVAGAVGVAFLAKNFAPETKGHGVPEVMDAIYYQKGNIRPIVAVIKTIASALSIGSGGSIGREGPIIQIGSSFGSTVGQVLSMPPWQRIALISAGAGAGIAATFNTPVGGILFAVEIMMNEISVRTLVPVAISTATATYIGRIFFGTNPSFVIPAFEMPYFHLTNPLLLISYAGLGVIMGVVSAIFIKSIYGFEDFFEKRIGGSYYRQHMLGMLVVGIMMHLLLVAFGHYYIEGVGYATIQDVLSGVHLPLYLLILLFVLKLLAVSLTLGSGASGGIFSPALYLGATLGAAYGIILGLLFPGFEISPPAFAVAGMAGVVGGATGAAMAAIVMIFEMTLNYNVIIPMTITVAIAYGIRKVLSKESIYTLKLVRRGHHIPEALQANILFVKQAQDVMNTSFSRVSADTTLDQFARTLLRQRDVTRFIVEKYGEIVGVVTRDSVLSAAEQMEGSTPLMQVASRDYMRVTEETRVLEIVKKMRSMPVFFALVIPQGKSMLADNVKGLIGEEEITHALGDVVELLPD